MLLDVDNDAVNSEELPSRVRSSVTVGGISFEHASDESDLASDLASQQLKWRQKSHPSFVEMGLSKKKHHWHWADVA